MSKSKTVTPELPAPPAPLLDQEEKSKTSNSFDRKTKLSSLALKEIFKKPIESQSENVKLLLRLLEGRVREGRRLSLRNWRAYAAIDEAFNVAFRQITPTLIGKIFDCKSGATAQEILTQLQGWGLSENTLFTTVKDENGVEQKLLNRETFWKILVPLVKSVTTVRAAKMYNDRDNDPFFVYEPSEISEASIAKGDILTQVFRVMTAQMGYKPIVRHAIMQALKYGKCVMFPSEAWFVEWDQDDKGNKYPRKEGIRFSIPHPTRCAIDPNYIPSSINTDTGIEWGCFWDLKRYGDVKADPLFYNLDKIPFGSNWADSTGVGADVLEKYFTEIYPCQMTPPIPYSQGSWSTSSEHSNSREKVASIYADAQSDTALFVTNLFCKLSPKQWGLGDYEPKIWIRFVMASDDTIIWAEPLPYTPMVFFGYDTDENSQDNCGVALEALPFQDLASNILSQHMLAVKQNLSKIILYDKEQVTPSEIKEMEARGKDVMYTHWLGYSSTRAAVAQLDPSKMFTPLAFAQQSTVELVSALNTVISIMERILNMSAQEVGAIAGHEQTAEEIKTISGYTSNRVQYSGTFIDDGICALKRTLYDGSRVFITKKFVVSVQQIEPDAVKILKDLGFELSENGSKTIEIKGDFSMLAIDAFISQREGQMRTNFGQIATPMLQAVTTIASNPELSQKVGAEWIVTMLERIAKMAGAPKDFKIRISPEQETMAQMKALAEQIQQTAQQIQQGAVQQSVQAVGEAVKPAIQQTQQAVQISQKENAGQQQQIDEMSVAVRKLVEMMTAMQAPPPPAPIVPGLVPQEMMQVPQ